MKTHEHARLTPLMALALVIHGLGTPPAWAGSTSGGINGGAGSSGGGASSPNLSQNYNDAAGQGDDAATKDMASAATWGGVAVTCGVACAASFIDGKSLDSVCSKVSIAGAAADAVMTQNMNGAFMALMSNSSAFGGASSAAAAGAQSGAQGAAAGAKSKSHESCLSAAVATLQAATKAMAVMGQKNASSQNAQNAQDLKDDRPTFNTDLPSGGSGPAPINVSTLQGSAPLSNGSTDPVNPGAGLGGSNSGGGPCTGNPQASYAQTIACAVRSDPNLPSFVRTPDFKKEFERATGGKPLNEFFGGTPAAMTAGIGAGISAGSGLSLDASQNLGKILAKALTTETPDTASGAYASSGGGGGPKSGASDDSANMGDIMKAMVDQMGGGEGEKQKSPGLSAIEYANKTRSPAAIADDPALSIFDRVTYRYTMVTHDWISAAPSVPTNTATR